MTQGLEYIHSKKRAHCDVAARSCLVGYGKIVKVANLGMSTDFSNNSFDVKPTPKNLLLPVRWSPPEVIIIVYCIATHTLPHTLS